VDRGPRSHTQWGTGAYLAGYVLVDGGFRSSAETPNLVEKRLKVLDFIEARLWDERFTKEEAYRAGEVEALRERIGQARARYRELTADR